VITFCGHQKDHENCRIQILLFVFISQTKAKIENDHDTVHELCSQSLQIADC